MSDVIAALAIRLGGRYTAGMSEPRVRRRLPFGLMAVGLLLGGYVLAYFMLSEVVQRSRNGSPIQSRVFVSEAALRVFRPLTWIESRFDQDRGFSHRPK